MIALNISLKSRSTRQIGAALALGILLGYAALVLGPLLVLSGMMGLILLIVAFTNPEIVILVVLCFVSGLIPARFNPRISLLVAHLQGSDLLLIGLLSVVVFRSLTDKTFRYVKTPLDTPLLLFYGAVVVAVGTCVFRFGINFSDATSEARILMYYLIFFAVTNLVRTRTQLLRLIQGVFSISLLVATTMILQTVLGRSLLLMDGSILRSGERLIRFFHPGTTAIYITLITLICDMALRKHVRCRWLRPLQLLVLGLGLLLVLDRNLLISGTVSLVVSILILRESQRSRLAGNLLLAAGIAVGVAGAFVISENKSLVLFAPKYLITFLDRMSRMFSGAILTSEENLLPRWVEIRYAWAHIVEHPIFGIGLWNTYRPPFEVGDTLRRYIHNAYVWIWLKTGLLGLVPFLWLSVRFLWRGFQHWRDVQDDFLRAASLGFTLAYLGMMISNLVAPFFVQDWSLAIFGVMLGINELIFAHNEATDKHKEGALHGVQQTTTTG